jgi:hypothetical protein
VHEVGNTVPRSIIAQQAADDGLLSFDGVRRDAYGIDLGVGRGIHGGHYTCSSLLAETIGEFLGVKKVAVAIKKKPGEPVMPFS